MILACFVLFVYDNVKTYFYVDIYDLGLFILFVSDIVKTAKPACQNLKKLALEGASRPSSKLVVNMFSLCTS